MRTYGADHDRLHSMTTPSAEVEMVWLDGWNTLYDAFETKPVILIDQEYRERSLDEMQTFIQEQAYSGYRVVFSNLWFRGKAAIRIVQGSPIDGRIRLEQKD